MLFLFQPNFRECFDNSGIVLKYVTNRNFDFPSFFLDRNPFGGAVCTTCPTAGYATLHVPLKKIDADINNMISEHSRFLHKQTIIGFVWGNLQFTIFHAIKNGYSNKSFYNSIEFTSTRLILKRETYIADDNLGMFWCDGM